MEKLIGLFIWLFMFGVALALLDAAGTVLFHDFDFQYTLKISLAALSCGATAFLLGWIQDKIECTHRTN